MILGQFEQHYAGFDDEAKWVVFANGRLCSCGHYGSAHEHNKEAGKDRCTERMMGKLCPCHQYTGHRTIAG